MASKHYIGPRTTVAPNIDKKKFEKDISVLEALDVWRGKKGKQPIRPLWANQREAVVLGAAYLRAKHNSAAPEGALIKMPTGSGKSGVVSLIARALPDTRRVLVLTPREGLVAQMMDDISWRFWQTMKLPATKDSIWSGPGISPAAVVKLLPNERSAAEVAQAIQMARCVIVGTLQALDQVRTERDAIARRARAGKPGKDDAHKLNWINSVLADLGRVDVIMVDEGHYEPAPSWSRSVRSLKRPTILLSATPFRNDYKLFSVRGAFTYNFPFPAARDERIVRNVSFKAVNVAASTAIPRTVTGDEDDGSAVAVSAAAKTSLEAFAKQLAALSKGLIRPFKDIGAPKIIVRAVGYEPLCLLQKALELESSETAVLIHERVATATMPTGKRAVDLNRFVQVRVALDLRPNARFWLHQTKLLEGIDESSFVAVALFDDFGNARQLVQQIGRVLRSSDPERKADQTATVISRSNDGSARHETSWGQYLAFEAAGADKLAAVIRGEADLPEKILPQMPDRQYVVGAFRERLPLEITLDKQDLLVPQKAVVFEQTPSYSFDSAAAETEEGILAHDRFVVSPVKGLPAKCRAWTFFVVDESPYLANHFVTQWRLGLTLIAEIGQHLYVYDSDGVPFDADSAGVRRVTRQTLAKLFRDSNATHRVRITRMSASSLDMSPRAVRATTTSTNSFADTFTDLLESVLLPTNVAGYVGATGRYLGLSRGRITDATSQFVSIDKYLTWAQAVEAELSANHRPSSVFSRFVQPATPDPALAAKPKSILIDLEPVQDFGSLLRGSGAQSTTAAPIDLLDLCADVTPSGQFELATPSGSKLEGRVAYVPQTGRYHIESEAMDRAANVVRSSNGQSKTLTWRLNETQAFRILTEESDKVYMLGQWVQARDLVVGGEVLPLKGAISVPKLQMTYSEKGEKDWAKKDIKAWRESSIFGLTHHYLTNSAAASADAYAKALKEFPLVLLDDDGTEMCDFVLVSNNKVVFLHAKAASKPDKGSQRAVTALQEVGRQAVAALAFYNAPNLSISDDRWSRGYTANKIKMPNVDRVFRNSNNIPKNEISDYVRRALVDPTRSKEVWIVLGKLIDLGVVTKSALSPSMPFRIRQLLMFIESLRTACGRANADLRLFG